MFSDSGAADRRVIYRAVGLIRGPEFYSTLCTQTKLSDADTQKSGQVFYEHARQQSVGARLPWAG